MPQLDLTCIILNYKTPEWIEKLLYSMQTEYFTHTKSRVKVVVVDNASGEPTHSHLQKIQAQFSHLPLEIIWSDQNRGFAGGNNLALKQASSRYVMLLNSDVEFTAASNLDEMLSYLDEHPEVAVMTPRLELSGGGIDWASHRGEPTPWASFTHFSQLAKIFPNSPLFTQYHQSNKDLTSTHEVDACSGAAMLVRTSAMEKVGYLDEAFFMYAEDLDWCKRFRDAGYHVIYFPHTTIIHHKYKSGRQNQDKKLAKKTSDFFYDTMLQYYDKHYRSHYPGVVRAAIQLFITLKKGVS